MKHKISVTLLLISMFFLTQLIGILVMDRYSPQEVKITSYNKTVINYTTYGLPYSMNPPVESLDPKSNLFSVIVAMLFAVIVMLLLIRLRAELFIRGWFFIVVSLAIGVTLYAFASLYPFKHIELVCLLVAIPLAYLKIFKRGFFSHNLTELMIYPGIAAIFVPILTIWTAIILLVFISMYDIYAVWKSGFMQKMAEFQIKRVKIFTGFLIPYSLGKENFDTAKGSVSRKNRGKKAKIGVAMLGGGDVVFPIILAGAVLHSWGILAALSVAIGATLALSFLFYFSEKGKFYPAMPFISGGCFIALIVASLLR